jgi:hypothetical protein
MDLMSLNKSLEAANFSSQINIDNLEKCIRYLFSSDLAKLERTNDKNVLEWNIEDDEDTHGCKFVIEDRICYLINTNNKFLEFSKEDSNAIVTGDVKNFTRSLIKYYRNFIAHFPNCKFNVKIEDRCSFKIYCSGYILNYILEKNPLAINNKGAKGTISMNFSVQVCDFDDEYLVMHDLASKIVNFQTDIFDYKEICRLVDLPFISYFQGYFENENNHIKGKLVNFINFITLDTEKYGPRISYRFTKPFSQLIAQFKNNSSFTLEDLSNIALYLNKCSSLVANNIDTSTETCGIYYKYLDLVKKRNQKVNDLRIALNARIKEAEKKKIIKEQLEEQEELITILSSISDNCLLLKVFASIHDIDLETFNLTFPDLSVKYKQLANVLYSMDTETRNLLLISNHIYV